MSAGSSVEYMFASRGRRVSRIAGIVGFGGDPPDPSELGAGTEGVFRENATLLFRGRRAGEALEQPVVSDRYALVVDGRIWEGWRTLLQRWAAVGVQALHEIIGPFALAVWDRRDEVLWLARGAVGTRALFWARPAQRVAFASEMAPLLRLGWISKDVATGHLAEYLSFRYVHSPRTLLRDVHSVPPGHVIRIDASGERIERWWNPPWSPVDAPLGDDAETAARVDAVLHRAVERRLGDNKVGVLLSGGLDSSAILHHARTLGAPPPTFTVTFEDEDSAEAPYAGRIAKLMGAEHHPIRLEPAALVDAIGACTAAMGAPLPGPSALVQHLFFVKTRGHVPIVLSGEGGDEVLGGRGLGPIAAGLRGTEAMRALPGPIRGLARSLAGRVGLSNLAMTGSIGLERVIGGSDVFPEKDRIAILQNPAHVRPGIRRAVLEPLYAEISSDAINEILHVRQVGWLSEDTIARSERMAAHAGLEVRYPMLDREMLEVTASIPGAMKVRRQGLGFTTKWPLRLAMEGRIPDQLLNRPKRTMTTPLDGWLKGAGVAFLVERTEAICADGLFHADAVRKLVNEHRSGHRDHAVRLWTLLFFQAWRESL
jgi:asparagine synthase (glutamine-hydrolysing)